MAKEKQEGVKERAAELMSGVQEKLGELAGREEQERKEKREPRSETHRLHGKPEHRAPQSKEKRRKAA